MSYLHNTTWERITREERFFCARLFELTRHAPGDFANWLSSRGDLGLPQTGEWDIGFEVALYRDLLWHRGRSAAGEGFSRKRTFDLCLFHEACVVIIEAKGAETFDHNQNTTFDDDRAQIPRLLGSGIQVILVGLASSRYLESVRRFGRRGALDVFDALITWRDVASHLNDAALESADSLYNAKPLHPIPLQARELEGESLYPKEN